MKKPTSFFRVFTETGPLIAVTIAIALLVGIAGPASAQFFNFGGPPRPQPRSNGGMGGGGWFGGDLFAPFQQQAPKPVENFSKAPPPAKRETVPERNVLVLGDAFADWLAYGLEDAYFEQPDMGVIRKHKTVSGLIKYQPKGDPADWAAAAKGILAAEKPDAIVVMLGLNDRISMREPAADKPDRLTLEDRVELTRGLSAEYANAKVLVPRSRKPLEFDAEAGTYDKKAWTAIAKESGPAARTGDTVQITRIELFDDHIVLLINGGFSARFVELTPEIQRDLIARTLY